MFEERDYVENGGWNYWHFVTIANPSGDGINFTWKNKANKTWTFTAEQDVDTYKLMGFDVHSDSVYYDQGFKFAEVVYDEETQQVKGVRGPSGELYSLVQEFAH